MFRLGVGRKVYQLFNVNMDASNIFVPDNDLLGGI